MMLSLASLKFKVQNSKFKMKTPRINSGAWSNDAALFIPPFINEGARTLINQFKKLLNF
jgi:hypothetical protein